MQQRMKRMGMDPLKDIVNEHDLRIYRYLVALEAISTYGRSSPPVVNEQAVKDFIRDNPAAQCRTVYNAQGKVELQGCGRWYLAEVGHCPFCHIATTIVTEQELEAQVEQWVAFHKEFSLRFHTNAMKRINAVRLLYYKEHYQQCVGTT